MSTFDAERFVEAVTADAWGFLASVKHDRAADVELRELKTDIEATLAALEVERDSRRARALREDLERFLPARRAAILDAVKIQDKGVRLVLEEALTFTERATAIVARAFVTGGF